VKREGLAAPSSDSKVELGEVDTVQSKRATKVADAGADGLEALAVGEVHQLAPIEMRVLADGGFLPPFGVIGPELFADMREFEPGVDTMPSR